MKTTFKKTFYRGFTLIELMIVIVIIGILAAALLPRLGSGQDRAFDLGVKNDIQAIGTSLELYIAEEGAAWDPTPGVVTCLDDTAPFASDLDGGMPTYQGSITVDAITCTNQYAYGALEVNGVPGAGYWIAGDVRVLNNANYVDSAITYTSSTTLADITGAEASSGALQTAEDTNPAKTIYVYAK